MKYQPYTLADMYAASEQNLFTVISTFAGAGGSSTGYKLAGGKVLVSNEFVEHAYESYKLNHPGTVVLTGDIKEIEGSAHNPIAIIVFDKNGEKKIMLNYAKLSLVP